MFGGNLGGTAASVEHRRPQIDFRLPKMYLAQELVDYIIDFLHDDPITLRQVSLVSRSWAGRTRIHLGETLKITRPIPLSSNTSHLPPLSGYVKTLHFTWPSNTTDPSTILDCFEQSEPRTLSIHSCELRALDEQAIRRCFTNFPCPSITALELHSISSTHETLLILLSLFPNVDDLTISVNRWSGRGAPNENTIIQRIPHPPLRGSFKLLDPPGQGYRGFQRGKPLRTIAALPLQFKTVSLNAEEQSRRDVSIFLNSCSKTVKKVFIGMTYRESPPCIPFHSPVRSLCERIANQMIDWPTLFDFAHLEKLYINAKLDNPSPQSARPFLWSVASPCLRRVILEARGSITGGAFDWPSIDESLVDLVERHKARGNVTLQIQISTTEDPEKVRELLPRAARESVFEVFYTERPGY